MVCLFLVMSLLHRAPKQVQTCGECGLEGISSKQLPSWVLCLGIRGSGDLLRRHLDEIIKTVKVVGLEGAWRDGDMV